MNDNNERDPRFLAIPDTHGHAKGEHKLFTEERPLPLTARMLFLWFYHACRRGYPRFLMVADHMNYLTFEDPAAVNLVRRALKLAQAGDLYGAAETATVEVGHAAVVSEGLRRGMRYSIGAEVDNDPRSRPDAQNIVDAMRPDGIIRSVHFIPVTHPVHGENWQWPFDNPEFADVIETVGVDQLWETYVTLLVDAIERLPGHIVGHFFVPAVFGSWPTDEKLSEYEDRVLAAAAARDMAIEFNTRFLYRDHSVEEKQRYLEANKRLLRKAKERGVQIAVGSDAHSPKDQGNGFRAVLAVLDELEINEIVFPLGGTLRRVALRVAREPEPEPVPVPAFRQAPGPGPVQGDAETAAGDAAESRKPARKPRPPKRVQRAEAVAAFVEVATLETVTETLVVEVVNVAPVEVEVEAAAADAAFEIAAPEPPRKVAAARKRPARPAVAVVAAPAAAPAPAPAAKPTAAKPLAAAPAKVARVKAAAKTPPPKAVSAPVKPAARAAKPQPKARTAAPKRPLKAKPVKAVAKKSAAAKPAAKKAAPARTAAKRAPAKRAPAKKAAPVKKAAKKATPARAAVKKKSPLKKATPKKAAPQRAAVRKATAAKKSGKKTAAKRR